MSVERTMLLFILQLASDVGKRKLYLDKRGASPRFIILTTQIYIPQVETYEATWKRQIFTLRIVSMRKIFSSSLDCVRY